MDPQIHGQDLWPPYGWQCYLAFLGIWSCYLAFVWHLLWKRYARKDIGYEIPVVEEVDGDRERTQRPDAGRS
jgi:hypothetical protein